jgi:hypothetical protein
MVHTKTATKVAYYNIHIFISMHTRMNENLDEEWGEARM